MTVTPHPVTGVAAGVPFTALAPADVGGDAPLVVTWHLMDPPCTDAAMAAALPMAGLRAWRVHLGLPLTGRRLPAGGWEELMQLGYEDAVLKMFNPVLSAAADESVATVRAVRSEFGIAEGPIGVVGGSAGGAVALEVIARGELPVVAAGLVNPMIRLAGAVAANERVFGIRYPWSDESRAVADRFDFVRRAGELARVGPAMLIVTGEADEPEFRDGAAALHRELIGGNAGRAPVELLGIPGMPHRLAEPPGIEPAPQNADAARVDAAFTSWFAEHLPGAG